MNRHYSSSKFVVWLRTKIFKIDKPYALGWGQWAKWDENLKGSRPIAFFFTETLPDWVEWIPEHSIDYLDNVRYYVKNRADSSHQLTSKLEKGKYHEFRKVMLHSMFDSFVDYLEIEVASSHVAWSNPEETAKYKIPFWRRIRILHWWQSWRSSEAAIAHLKWEMALTDSPLQAEAAKEKMFLYTWWSIIRPTRETDSWKESGLREFWDEMETKYGEDWLGLGSSSKLSTVEKKKYRKLQALTDEVEANWEQEDDDMMIRLVKLSSTLWT